MKNRYKIGFLTALVALFGCFEDKGNYDYENINEIVIAPFVAEGWTASYADTLKIKPEITFKGSSDESSLSYQWSFGDLIKEGWNKRDFHWIADTAIRANLILRITDHRNGMVYMQTADYNVAAEFGTEGAYVLSEKDGKSQLSFIKLIFDVDYGNRTSKVKEAKIHQNIYEERAKEVLGQGPIGLHEHYFRTSGSAAGTQLLVLQNSGVVDVVSSTMTKDIDLKQAFVGGAYPMGTYFNQASFMSYADVLIDQHGQLFSRIKLVANLFHSSYFFQEPLKFEDKVLKNCRLFNSVYKDDKYTLIEDRDNKRFLAVLDGKPVGNGGLDSENAGRIVVVPGVPASAADLPKGFIPLDNFGDNVLIDGGYYRNSYGCGNFFMLFRTSAGEYVWQEFQVNIGFNTIDMEILNARCGKVTLPGEPSIVYPLQFQDASKDVFFAIGNDLYLFSRDTPEAGVKGYLTNLPGKIASINSETYMNRQGILALENDKVYVLDLGQPKNFQTWEQKVIFESPDKTKFGKIVSVKMRTGGNAW